MAQTSHNIPVCASGPKGSSASAMALVFSLRFASFPRHCSGTVCRPCLYDVEALYQRTYNGLYGKIRKESVIAIINTIGKNRNADFIFDVIEDNFVNNSEYRIVTRAKHIIDLIEKELDFQLSGHASDETMVRFDKVMGAKYVLNIGFANNKIQIKIIDVEGGNTIIQESI